MTENNELVRLEEIIENLLDRYNKLEAENRKNLNTIEDQHSTIEDLQARLTGLEQEKEHVQHRISGILQSIEDWESRGQAEEGDQQPSTSPDEPSGSDEKWPKLFGTDS